MSVITIALALYAVGRFGLTALRQERAWFWGLQEAQVLVIGALAVALALLARRALRQRAPVGGAPVAAS